MNRRWFRTLFRRRVLVILMLLIQAVFLIYLITSTSRVSQIFSSVLTLVSLLAVLYIVSKKDKGAYKTTWVFLILSFPLFGGLLYLLFHFQTSGSRQIQKLKKLADKAAPLALLPQEACGGDACKMDASKGNTYIEDAYKEASKSLDYRFSQVRYLQEHAGFPIYASTTTKYFSPGEEMLKALLPELWKAEKYIFLEFFIVEEGLMWDSILEILKEKASQGVKVRLIYDDLGCFLLLPNDYPEQLKKYGIECLKFNPFRPLLTVKQNNRDHRKIISIDGKVAFTGGINLADEYINAVEKFGHWKDCAVMIKGKAAWSFTLMFLQMWELCTGQDEDYSAYYPWEDVPCDITSDGFVQPYADSPSDGENVGEHVYLQILNQAQDYVYINTPYLIVDDSMVSALTLTAKRGVDVRIITPHRWDKWIIHMTTRSYYRELVKAGVKIYEYTSGFNHAKTFVSDDRTATVGTTNLDFRSLYLHFECGALIFDSTAVMEVKEDFIKTLKVCQPVTEKDCNPGVVMRLFQDILRLFAPLM